VFALQVRRLTIGVRVYLWERSLVVDVWIDQWERRRVANRIGGGASAGRAETAPVAQIPESIRYRYFVLYIGR
jgi:hypothetical protein